MQFTFGDKREVYLQGESALPVTEKESMPKGKPSLDPKVNCMHRDVIRHSFSRGLSNKKQEHTTNVVVLFNLIVLMKSVLNMKQIVIFSNAKSITTRFKNIVGCQGFYS